MKRSTLTKSIFAVFFLFGAYSCLDMEVEKQYYADVYNTVRIVDGDTLYGLEAYVTSNNTMDSVTMKGPDGSEWELKAITSGYYEFVTPADSYRTTIPAVGSYSFTITFEDEILTTYDKLTSSVAKPVEIDSVLPYSNSSNAIMLGWHKTSNVDCFSIRICKDDVVSYASGLIDTSFTSGVIYAYSSGWGTGLNPDSGDTVSVFIDGVLLEENLTSYTEFQSIARSAEHSIIWPE